MRSKRAFSRGPCSPYIAGEQGYSFHILTDYDRSLKARDPSLSTRIFLGEQDFFGVFGEHNGLVVCRKAS